MPHTLVTGANSFVASNLIATLLEQGHTVTGSVRRQSSGEELLKLHPEWKGSVDFIEIKDYGIQGAWDQVFKDRSYDYIAAVAAPIFSGTNVDFERDFLKPAIDNNLAMLQSAKEHAQELKHISITGSINAITMGDDLATREITNDGWNNISIEDAKKANQEFVSYCSSKKEAEKAVWEFIEKENPSFGVTVFLPALIFGPPIQPVKDSKHLNFSVGLFNSLIDGSNETVPATMFPSYIDVRDLSLAHIRAFTVPEARNRRFLIGGMPLTYTAMVRAIKTGVEKGEIPREVLDTVAKEGTADANTPVPKIRAEEGNKILDMKFRTLEETIRDMTLQILKIKERSS